MAYLMKTKQFHLKDAFDYIKQRRSVVSPNFGFMGQLLQYESEILPSTPTPQAPSCQGEADGPSLLAHLQTLSPDVQASYCTPYLGAGPGAHPLDSLRAQPEPPGHSHILLNPSWGSQPSPKNNCDFVF